MSRTYIKKNYMGTTLRRLIESLNPGKPIIGGKLSVTAGHDYWWFLEYGTGEWHEEPEGFIPQAADRVFDPHIQKLLKPRSAYGEVAGGTYDITVRNKPLLVYVSKGHIMRRHIAVHTGIRPIGIVRTALFDAELYMKEAIAVTTSPRKSKTWDHLPTRKELVELVNDVLDYLLLNLVMTTPEAPTPGDDDYNPYHEGRHPVTLAEAWRVTKAR